MRRGYSLLGPQDPSSAGAGRSRRRHSPGRRGWGGASREGAGQGRPGRSGSCWKCRSTAALAPSAACAGKESPRRREPAPDSRPEPLPVAKRRPAPWRACIPGMPTKRDLFNSATPAEKTPFPHQAVGVYAGQLLMRRSNPGA